jgi:hypothetical protein
MQTYLKCSLVWSPRFPKYLLMMTMHVVKILKRNPNPSTTRYPIPTERGGSPPNMDSCPLYLSKGGNSSSMIDDTMMLEQVKSYFQRLSQVGVGKRVSLTIRHYFIVEKVVRVSNTNPKALRVDCSRQRTRFDCGGTSTYVNSFKSMPGFVYFQYFCVKCIFILRIIVQ